MRASRLLLASIVCTSLAAAATDDLAATPRELLQAQSEIVSSPQTESTTKASSSQGKSSPSLDRRDRIFYPGDTERLKPLGRKLILNILLDQKEIFTSPFHMNRHNVWSWLLSGATTAGLIAADHHIADSFENSRGQLRWAGRISNIGATYTLIPLVAGYYGFGVWRDHAKAREIGSLAPSHCWIR